MKITIIADTFGIENNGTAITLRRLIDGLLERGHDVKVVSTYKSDDKMYYTLPKINFQCFNGYVAKNGVELAKPDKKILREAIEGSDVVHIAMPFATGKTAQKICLELGIPHTAAFHVQAENVTSHFGLKNCKLATNFVYRVFYNKFYKNTHFVHCPTALIANILRAHKYDMDLRVISNGVIPFFKKIEAKKPLELEDKFIITFVGRYSKEKRHDLLINAVKASKYRDKIQLVFPGCGPCEKNMKKLSAGFENPPIMAFYEKDALRELFNYTDLYVHPSDIEIEAIACLEAISCGCVPLISNSPRSATNAFALTENNLFDYKDVSSLTRRIDFFFEHREYIAEQKNMYNDFCKQFEISHCIDQMVDMFNDAVNYQK